MFFFFFRNIFILDLRCIAFNFKLENNPVSLSKKITVEELFNTYNVKAKMSQYPLLSYLEYKTGRLVGIHYHLNYSIGKLNIPQNSCLVIHPLLNGGTGGKTQVIH